MDRGPDFGQCLGYNELLFLKPHGQASTCNKNYLNVFTHLCTKVLKVKTTPKIETFTS